MAHGEGKNRFNRNSHSFSERRFRKSIIQIDNRPIGAHILYCTTAGCGKQGELLDRTSDGYPPEFIIRKFTQKGWFVGPDTHADLCPSCYKTEVAKRRQRRSPKLKLVSPVKPAEPPPTEPEMVADAAETPPTISRSDWRIIHSKLEEVYQDEEHGYRAPWTDAAVARDLGVHIPVAWVAQVREHAFGPAKDNEEIRDMLERVSAAAIEAKELLAGCKKHGAEVTSLVAATNALMAQARDVGKTLDGLLILADRISKAVRS